MPGISRILANTIKLRFDYSGPDSRTAKNIMYCQLNTPGTITTSLLNQAAAQAVDAFTGTSSNGPQQAMNHLWQLLQVEAVDNSGASEAIGVQAAAFVGAVTGDPCPPQVAVCAGWTIGAHYRGGHPRTYFPGVSVSQLATPGGAHLSTAATSLWATAAGAMLTEFNLHGPHASTFTLGCIAGSRHGAQLTPPVFYPYLAAVVHNRLDSQRRRSGPE